MSSIDTTLLSEADLYEIIVDVVGDETSLEFCTLSDHYLDGHDLDMAMKAHMTDWEDIRPLVDKIESRAETKRNEINGSN